MNRHRLFLSLFIWLGLALLPVYGQTSGQSFDGSDLLADTDSFQFALENNRSGTASEWRNPDAEYSEVTVPVKTFQTSEGNYCREFQQTITIDGRQERGYGTACRQPDGQWLIVNPQDFRQADPQPVRVTQVRAYDPPRYFAYPPRYYAYPARYAYPYYPRYLSLNFGYVKHKGYSHYGHRYHRGYKGRLHNGKSRHSGFGKAYYRSGTHRGKWGGGHRRR